MTETAAKKTTDPIKVREAKRAFFTSRVNYPIPYQLVRQFYPGLALSFVNVPSGTSSQEKPIQNKTDQPSRQALRKFTLHLFDLTWRLLIAMAVPVFAGAFLDKKLATDDLFTGFGFLLSLVAAGFVIKYMYEKLSPEENK